MSRRCHSLSLARAAREEFSTQHKATTPSMTPVLSSFDIKSQNPKNSLNFHSLLFSTTTSSSYNYLISHQSSRNSIKRVVRRPNIKQPYGNIIKKRYDLDLMNYWSLVGLHMHVANGWSLSLVAVCHPCLAAGIFFFPCYVCCCSISNSPCRMQPCMHSQGLQSCMEHHVHLIFGVCLL